MRRRIVVTAFAALAVACAAVPISSGGAERGTGSLALNTGIAVVGRVDPGANCPPDAPPEAELCAKRSGSGRVPGLGLVMESYWAFADENPSPGCGGVRVLRSTGQFEVVGKGTVQFDLARMEQCVLDQRHATQPFTITGGSGVFAGASGAGTVNHDLNEQSAQQVGTDSWSGSLDVPGLEFDLTAPALNGLVNKTVRVRKGVKRVRVTYRVTAQDLIDGSRPVRCQPGSGTRFRVGRTVVKCSAMDTSANTATGSFRVVVKRRR